MKNTGIIRKIDELGRIVIPKEIRQTMRINNYDDLAFFIEDDTIVLKKYSVLNSLKSESDLIVSSVDDLVDCLIYISDKEKIITKGDIENEELPEIFINILLERKIYESLQKEEIYFGTIQKDGYFLVYPIIQNSDPIGLVILQKNENITSQDKFFANVLKNIIENK